MPMGLTLADIGDLLEQPIVAVLATYRRDGTVLLSPVWFEHRDGLFQVWCGSIDEGKVRHVLHDPRASLVIAEQTVPWRGVEAVGRISVSSDDFRGVLHRTAERYEGPDAPARFDRSYPQDGVVLRLSPDKLRVWDLGD
jgi:PPOX class probable F420-dependent enzyme